MLDYTEPGQLILPSPRRKRDVKRHGQEVARQKPLGYATQEKLGRNVGEPSDVVRNRHLFENTHEHNKIMNRRKAITKSPTA